MVTRTRLCVLFIRKLPVLLSNDVVRSTTNSAAVKQTVCRPVQYYSNVLGDFS